MSKNYDKRELLNKLSKRQGLTVKYKQGTRKVRSLECSPFSHIGIKLWGYIDFLGLLVNFKKIRSKSQKKFQPKVDHTPEAYFRIRWFPDEAEVKKYIAIIKNAYAPRPIKSEYVFNGKDWRVIVETTK